MWVPGIKLRIEGALLRKVPSHTHLGIGKYVSVHQAFAGSLVCIVLLSPPVPGLLCPEWTLAVRSQRLLLVSIGASMGPACCCFLPLPQADEEILGQGCWPPRPRVELPFSLFFPVLDAYSSHTESLTETGCLAVLNKVLELASWLCSPLSPLPAPWDTLQRLVTACPSEVGI